MLPSGGHFYSAGDTPPFTAVGREYIQGRAANGAPVTAGFPMISTLLSLTKGEQWFFGLVHEAMHFTTNTAHILSSSIPKSDRPKMSKAYTALRAKGLVKRIRKQIYLVNPDAVFHPHYYKAIKEKWDSLP